MRGQLSEKAKQNIIRGYESTGYGYAPYYAETAHSINHGIDSDEFGLAFISQDYVHSYWSSAGLKVLEITEAAKRWQDMVVLRKE